MAWFKLHTEIRTDYKLKDLTGDQFRLWVYLLCLASEVNEQGSIPMLGEELAWQLRVDPTELASALAIFSGLGLVTLDGSSVQVVNFQKRQGRTREEDRDRKRRERDSLGQFGTRGASVPAVQKIPIDIDIDIAIANKNKAIAKLAEPSSTEEAKPIIPEVSITNKLDSPSGKDSITRPAMPDIKQLRSQFGRYLQGNAGRQPFLQAIASELVPSSWSSEFREDIAVLCCDKTDGKWLGDCRKQIEQYCSESVPDTPPSSAAPEFAAVDWILENARQHDTMIRGESNDY